MAHGEGTASAGLTDHRTWGHRGGADGLVPTIGTDEYAGSLLLKMPGDVLADDPVTADRSIPQRSGQGLLDGPGLLGDHRTRIEHFLGTVVVLAAVVAEQVQLVTGEPELAGGFEPVAGHAPGLDDGD